MNELKVNQKVRVVKEVETDDGKKLFDYNCQLGMTGDIIAMAVGPEFTDTYSVSVVLSNGLALGFKEEELEAVDEK